MADRRTDDAQDKKEEKTDVEMTQMRQERGMSQVELGRILEVSPTTVGSWEVEKCLQYMLTLARISAWLLEDVLLDVGQKVAYLSDKSDVITQLLI